MWENYMAADLRWNHLLQQQDSYLKFVLNGTQDSLPTPSRLNTWQQESAGDGRCPLGCKEKGTLKHILCGCWIALKEEPQSRITWRHDSILLAIFRGVMDRIQEANAQPRQEDALPPIKLKSVETLNGDSLVSNASGNSFTAPAKPTPLKCVLEKATDWQVQFDINEEGQVKDRNFPPEIAVVTGEGSRPDGVIWSMESKTVIWIELTSPWETNMPKQHDYKINRSNQLAIDLREGKYFGVKWTVLPFYVEIGARGAVHDLDSCNMGYNRMCSKLGFTGKARKRLTKAVQMAAVHASHFIFLCRFHKKWEPQRLLDTWKRFE